MLSTMMRRSTLVTTSAARGVARRGYADLRGSGEKGAFRVWMEENPYMNMGLGIVVGYFAAVYIDRNIVRPKLEDKPKH